MGPLVCLLLLLPTWGWTAPPQLPSTSLNLPVQEAIERGPMVVAHVADSGKDYSHVESTFKEPKIKDYLHQTYTNLLRPTPIVDNLREEDKYGNTGDQLDAIGNVIVKGTEVGTQFLGVIASLPRNAIASVSNKVTQALNGVGAYIIGL